MDRLITEDRQDMQFVEQGDRMVIKFQPGGEVNHPLVCCDCSLVHGYVYTLRGRTLYMTPWRMERATEELRRVGQSQAANPLWLSFFDQELRELREGKRT